MIRYTLQRLLLLPITLLVIIFVNFVIINLAPGDPSTISEISAQGGALQREGQMTSSEQGEPYRQFREFFGLTLPIVLNTWHFESTSSILDELTIITTKQEYGHPITHKKYSEIRTEFGDKSHFILDHLEKIMSDESLPISIRWQALHYFILGGHRSIIDSTHLSSKELAENRIIRTNNFYLDNFEIATQQDPTKLIKQIKEIAIWYEQHRQELIPENTISAILHQCFFETRFAKYFSRILRLDFGVTRRDPNQLVISEVISRLKYSLTLSIIPMICTLVICVFLGMIMAIFKDSFFDKISNLFLLLCYATPVFVVAPYLIEKVALHHNYPGTDLPFPIRGFSSPDSIFFEMTSWQRLEDIARHITLPLISIFYTSLAIQSRLSRAAFLSILHQDYISFAKAKGVHPITLYTTHAMRNALIPIITSVAGSLGVILGGSVIVETIFEIHGFGKFFYDAIVNRDYNVMMFSVFVGSFLSLLGYLLADLTYMWLDPRIDFRTST